MLKQASTVGARNGRPRTISAGQQALKWISPAGIVLIFVFGYSLISLFTQSFRYDGKWVAFENFTLVLTDPLFQTALKHNFYLLFTVPVMVFLAFLLAVTLFETRRGMSFYRAAVFLPYVLPIPVVAVVFGQIYQLRGALNIFLTAIGLDGLAQDWLGEPKIALGTMASVILWKEVGFGVILLLAHIISLPSEVFEASRIDGAGFFRVHWSITRPQIMNTIVFFSVIEAITMVSWVFNYVYVMSNGLGGPGDSTLVSELYIYRSAFSNKAPELAAAAAVCLFLCTLLLVVAFFRIQRRSISGTFGR
ncbi:MAG: sugar ABC transporter permease [Actinomycetes bacterium]|nr:sugar ABC transporter permease [Actinomycetota bacterium]